MRVQSVSVKRHQYCQDLAETISNLSYILAYRAISDRRMCRSGTHRSFTSLRIVPDWGFNFSHSGHYAFPAVPGREESVSTTTTDSALGRHEAHDGVTRESQMAVSRTPRTSRLTRTDKIWRHVAPSSAGFLGTRRHASDLDTSRYPL